MAEKAEAKKGSVIATCYPCKRGKAASFQDQRYGLNQRVFTVAMKKNEMRCTVCGASK